MGDQPKVSQAKAVVCRPQVGFEGMHGLRLNREAEPILFKIAHPEPVSLSLEALPPHSLGNWSSRSIVEGTSFFVFVGPSS